MSSIPQPLYNWVNLKNQTYIDYHDIEWGEPLHDDHLLFELLCLECAQAGVTWEMVLNKRKEYRKCFWNFDIETLISKTDEELFVRIQDFGVIKNRLKTIGVKKNALAFKKLYQNTDRWISSFGVMSIINRL